ncbi:MAG: hypothetical protein MHPSP_004131, partial [Paramarteilia canceri]
MAFLWLFSVIYSENQYDNQHIFMRTIKYEDSKKIEVYIEDSDCSWVSIFNNAFKRCYPCLKGTKNVKHQDDGKIKCNGCAINYYYSNDDSIKGGYKCTKCPDQYLASDVNSHKNMFCNEIIIYNTSDALYQGKIQRCNDWIKNSIGRDIGSPPIFMFCKCPNSSAKVYFQDRIKNIDFTMTCTNSDILRNIVDYKGLDYIVLNVIITNGKRF